MTAEKRLKIKELFTDESKWTQRSLAKDSGGIWSDPQDPKTVCWCLIGAVCFCYPMKREYYNVISKIDAKVRHPAVWNDAPERTFKEVKALVEELDI